jgi:hypothetical protein
VLVGRSPQEPHEVAVFSGKFDTVVIILSTGRTGTMALAQYLDTCYDQVKGLHEPPPSRHLRIASNRYLCGRVSKDDLVGIFARSRRRLFEGISEPIYVEANNFLHGFLDAFEEIFDAPRVVHVVRDPRTFIRSWINFGVFRGLKGLAGRYYPFWLLKPERYEKNPARRWSRMARPERIAWYWNAINRELNRGQELFGQRYLRLRFEEIFAEEGSELSRLVRWMGLPERDQLLAQARKQRINPSRDAGFPPWQQWDPGIQQSVLDLAGRLMTQYGYDTVE